ncbi:LemA family protein [Algoriphagus sp. PAP.12]|uniref:LemA family protein n=1 Tax=Algoriphagus sp. PAP.12 TaxID=2996678 RepID=UPI00227C1C04|nr:LemA family protein [Algoriphagus sp. PAP.12]
MNTSLMVFLAITALIVIIAVIINNKIIFKKNQVSQAYGSIEIYLKKRFDLVPNLAAMVKKYMAHEKEILLKITELRSQIEGATDQKEKIKASNQLTKMLGGLNINIENYPDLKADKQFHHLQYEVSEMEDQISAARRAYNAAVIQYNNQIQMFPSNLIAGLRKDEKSLFLEIPKSDQKEVNLDQLLNS